MVPLYMDHNVRIEITEGLRARRIDVLTASEDGRDQASDPDLLTRATELGRVFFTTDADLLVEAARRQGAGELFAGVIYGHQLRITIGRTIDDLAVISLAGDPPDLLNQVQHLPL